MKFGIAEYGMNMWDGAVYDNEQRWVDLKAIGYEGMERINAQSTDDLIHKAALMRKHGFDFATVRAPTPELSIPSCAKTQPETNQELRIGVWSLQDLMLARDHL